MPQKIEGLKVPFVPVGGVEGLSSPRPLPKDHPSPFDTILKEKLDASRGLKFSAHARTRLQSRNIELTPDLMDKLATAVEKAETKGARDSLVLVNDVAFIVSVNNRTVITAIAEEQLQENVFTNIDSAIIFK
ncbi:MAG: hypothetical protein GXO78_03580 [Calditrichaeota bacterium]|nr:hypothetical protein [Calditrichota bacterium]